MHIFMALKKKKKKENLSKSITTKTLQKTEQDKFWNRNYSELYGKTCL